MQSTSSEWKLCDKVLSRGLVILVERNFSEQSIHMNVPQHLGDGFRFRRIRSLNGLDEDRERTPLASCDVSGTASKRSMNSS